MLGKCRASPATAAAFSSSAAATLCGGHLPDQDHLKADFLKGQLVLGATQEPERPFGRFMRSAQLDPDWLAKQMGKVILHFTIQNEGDIGIKLLLKLKQLKLSMFPRTSFEHRQNQNILTGVMGKGIEHSGTLDSRTDRGLIVAGQIFAEGNHT